MLTLACNNNMTLHDGVPHLEPFGSAHAQDQRAGVTLLPSLHMRLWQSVLHMLLRASVLRLKP